MRCSALGHQGTDELRDTAGHLSGRQRTATQRAVVRTHDQSTRHPSPCKCQYRFVRQQETQQPLNPQMPAAADINGLTRFRE
jgi:hypothetical protein